MSDIEVSVRAGTKTNIPQVLNLVDQARRQYLTFGEEDLKRLVSTEPFLVALTGPLLWGFCLCAVEPRSWASIRGLALSNGWRTWTAMQAILLPMHETLRARKVRRVYCLGHESWLPPALLDLGYRVDDRIVTYEHPPHPTVMPEMPGVQLRPARPNDLDIIEQIDQAAFHPPWVFARRELIHLLLTSSYSVIAELDGQAAGYTCSDVKNGIGQIIRVAVLPQVQGRGVGRTLTAGAINACYAAGAGEISLNTQVSNVTAQHLYETMSFRRSGRSVPVLTKEI